MSETSNVFWKDAHGKVLKVDPNEASTAEQAGWKPASDKEIADAYKKKEAGSAAGIAKTAVESTAAGAMDAALAIPHAVTALGSKALGTDDPLARFSGRQFVEDVVGVGTELSGGRTAEAAGKEFGQNQRTRAEVNPGTAFTGELTGQLLGSGGITGLGKAAGRGALGAVGEGLAGRLASSAATMGAEGGMLGLAAEQNTAYLEERKLTADAALASVGVGGLMGAGLGLVAKGGAEVFGAARRGASGALERAGIFAEKAAPAVEGAVEKGAVNEESALRRVLHADEGSIEAEGRRALQQEPLPEFAKNVKRAIGGENLTEAVAIQQGSAARELRAQINQMETATKQLTPEWRELKAENVAKTIAKEPEAFQAQSVAAQDQIGAIRAKVDEMRADPLGYGQAGLKQLDNKVALAERNLAKAIESGKGEDLMVTLDGLKRDMGPHARGPEFGLSQAERASKTEIRELYEGVRQSLMKPEVWGEAGEMQKAVNEPFTKWLATKDLFDQRFLTKTGREGWFATRGADPAGIESYVNGLGKSRNDLTHSIIEQHIESTRELGEALTKAGGMTPEKAAELKAITTAAESFKKTVSTVQEKVGSLNQAVDYIEATKHGGNPMMASLVGSTVGGLPGAAAGFMLDAAVNPAKSMAVRLRLADMAERSQKLIGTSLDKLFESAPIVVDKVKSVGRAVQQTSEVAAKAAVPASLALFTGKHASAEIAYRKRAEELYAYNQNMGGAVRQAIGNSFGESAAHEREALTAMTMSATTGINYLLSKLPSPLYDPQTLTPLTSRPKPSKAEIMQFADIWTAVMKPMAMIADIPKGTVSQEQMQAFKATHASLFDWMQDQAWKRIQQADARGQELTIRTRVTLDNALNLNGAGERAFTPAFGAKYGQMMGDAANKPPPRPRGAGSSTGIGKGLGLTTRTSVMLGG